MCSTDFQIGFFLHTSLRPQVIFILFRVFNIFQGSTGTPQLPNICTNRSLQEKKPGNEPMIDILFSRWDTNSEFIPKHPKCWPLQAVSDIQSEGKKNSTNPKPKSKKMLCFKNLSRTRKPEHLLWLSKCTSAADVRSYGYFQEYKQKLLSNCSFIQTGKVSLLSGKITRS